MYQFIQFTCFAYLLSYCAGAILEHQDDKWMHPDVLGTMREKISLPNKEQDAIFWKNLAKQRVKQIIKNEPNFNKAKNVIFFLGDGMSIPTVTAARIYMGQLNGMSGEEAQLSFEKFPTSGLSKTYCINTQVADSACSATAYLTGVKANFATIGVSGHVSLNNCQQMQNTSYHVHSLAKLFVDNKRSAGIVTTTRVTHASPAGAYAHTANRNWESDSDIIAAGFDPLKCKDIAHQLIHGDPGKYFKVILGGGRMEFRPSFVTDEEGAKGVRSDGRNLIDEWKEQRIKSKEKFQYVWNKKQLLNVSRDTENLMGLFEADHLHFHWGGGNKELEPTFEEMVESAIKVLSKNKKGYFLFAEGGRIDHGHHSVYSELALDETVEFSKGIAKAVSMTDEEDTLIVVTSDHAHVMTISGYPSRGNPILGQSDFLKASDGLPYMTLGYANGPGYRKEVDGKRVDVTKEMKKGELFLFPSMVPTFMETHGGDDVGVFARGPWNHLFTGVYEQSFIPHLISYATCLDKDLSAC